MTWDLSPVPLSTAWASPSSLMRALRHISQLALLSACLKTGASPFRVSSFIIPAADSNRPPYQPLSRRYGFKFYTDDFSGLSCGLDGQWCPDFVVHDFVHRGGHTEVLAVLAFVYSQ